MTMRRLILGTAGHIDHGKTALVRALTGVDTDRLKEEKERGITVDLGFAELVSPESDLRFGVVDVPGHDGFIKNMLAGATGMDLVLLVVAADEGIMPQTREHLAIVELLGVPRLVVAVAKSDLVEEEWLDLVDILVRRAEISADSSERRDLLFRVAVLYEKEIGDVEEAIAAYTQVNDVAGADRDSLAALTRLYQKSERWPELLEVYEI